MKIRLELNLSDEALDIKKFDEEKVTKEDMKNILTEMLFEVCEGWVLKGETPNFEFVGDTNA